MILSMVCPILLMLSILDMAYLFWVMLSMTALTYSVYGGYFNGMYFMDMTSMMMVFITITIMGLSLMSMKLGLWPESVLNLMMLMLVLSFMTYNGLLFYLMFEFTFMLMFSFIMGWGLTSQRMQASFYMFFYTMVFSLPMLIMLIDSNLKFSNMFYSMNLFNYKEFLWVFMVLVFIVKLPLFGFHLWLPKAHVEAPVAGSMILAGLLLKLGGYGMFRFSTILENFSFYSSMINSYLFYVAMYGGLLTNMLCLRQVDLKMMIAYSSIVHMSLMMVGIMCMNSSSLTGSLLMMVAHGLISPLLFVAMFWCYGVMHSRSTMILKGFSVISPLLSIVWFISCAFNMGLPPFMSFFSEMLIMGSLSFLPILDFAIMVMFMMMTGIYCIMMFTTLTHGAYYHKIKYTLNTKNFTMSVSHLLFILSYPVLFFLL